LNGFAHHPACHKTATGGLSGLAPTGSENNKRVGVGSSIAPHPLEVGGRR
jgi:hypothetical protein